MAERIVVLGWGNRALELDNALDADVLVTQGSCRVTMTMFSGELANAIVLYPAKPLLGVVWENSKKKHHDRAFRTLKLLCPRAREFKVKIPIPLRRAA